MKIWKDGKLFGQWKSTISIGFVLSGIGLAFGTIVLTQVIPALLHGAELPQGHGAMIVESMIALLLTMIGFALMVVGSDPFDDASGEFLNSENERR